VVLRIVSSISEKNIKEKNINQHFESMFTSTSCDLLPVTFDPNIVSEDTVFQSDIILLVTYWMTHTHLQTAVDYIDCVVIILQQTV